MWKGIAVLCASGLVGAQIATEFPSKSPTIFPTRPPTVTTLSPTFPAGTLTASPTFKPTLSPTKYPTNNPTKGPLAPTAHPTRPTRSPTSPIPSASPSIGPTSPTDAPTKSPTSPTASPSLAVTPSPTAHNHVGGFSGGSFSPAIQTMYAAVFTRDALNITRDVLNARFTAPATYTSTAISGLPTVSFRLQSPLEFPPPLLRPDLERQKVYVTFPVFMDFKYVAMHLEAYVAALRVFFATELTANYYQFREFKFHRNRDDLTFGSSKIRSPDEVENTARHAGALGKEEGLMSFAICYPTVCADEWDDDYPGWAWMLTFVVPISTAVLCIALCYVAGCLCFEKATAEELEEEMESISKKAKEDEEKEKKRQLIESTLHNLELRFTEGSAKLVGEEEEECAKVLKKVTDLMDTHNIQVLEIQGHGHSKDAKLSQSRAVHVLERLIGMGVPKGKLTTEDRMDSTPVPGSQPSDPRNNRVIFEIPGETLK